VKVEKKFHFFYWGCKRKPPTTSALYPMGATLREVGSITLLICP